MIQDAKQPLFHHAGLKAWVTRLLFLVEGNAIAYEERKLENY
jgi:hypothetical protein